MRVRVAGAGGGLERVERACTRSRPPCSTPRDWTARFVSPRTLGGIEQPAPIVRGGVELPGRSQGRSSGRGCTSPRSACTSRRSTGSASRDEELAPGLDVLRPTGCASAPTTSRRCCARAPTRSRCCSATAGTAGGSAGTGAARSTATGSPRWPSWRSRSRRRDRPHVRHRRDVDGGGERGARRRPLRRADHRPAFRSRRPGEPVDVLDDDLGRLVPPAGPPVRAVAEVPAVVALALARRDGCSSTSGRTSSAGYGCACAAAPRAGGCRPARRGARTRRARGAAAALGEGHRRLRARGETPCWSRRSPSTASVTPSWSGVSEEQVESATAVVLSSDLRPTGSFACSAPDVETLHANVVRSMRGNFLDVPTDCPQRDERLGWTGDIQVFAPTAAFLADCAGFLDVVARRPRRRAAARRVGAVRGAGRAAPSGGSGRSGVGRRRHRRAVGALRALRRRRACSPHSSTACRPGPTGSPASQARTGSGPAASSSATGSTRPRRRRIPPPRAPIRTSSPPPTSCAPRSSWRAPPRCWAGTRQRSRYADLAATARDAFAREFVSPSGRLHNDAPTAYALALVWDLLADPGAARATPGARLADLVRDGGLPGRHRVRRHAADHRRADASRASRTLAYRLLLERGCPSWLYPVTMGATTIWERWDSMLPDGSINPGEMTSFNHYALGAVADWLHRVVAGLAPAAPGYRRDPRAARCPAAGSPRAAARHETPYGPAAVSWERADGRLPALRRGAGRRAGGRAPAGQLEPVEVGHGHHHWDVRTDPVEPRPVRTVRDAIDARGCGTSSSHGRQAGLASDSAVVAGAHRPVPRRPGAAARTRRRSSRRPVRPAPGWRCARGWILTQSPNASTRRAAPPHDPRLDADSGHTTGNGHGDECGRAPTTGVRDGNRRRGAAPDRARPRRGERRAEGRTSMSDPRSREVRRCGSSAIETPSWAYANSGTRFKVFAQAGVPRTPQEKIADAAVVHRLTGVAPTVALHIPWDRVDDYGELAKYAADQGVRGRDDQLQRVPGRRLQARPRRPTRTRGCAARRSTTCWSASTSWTPRAPGTSSCGSPTAPTTPGRTRSGARQDRLAEALREVYDRLGADQRMLLEYKLFEPAFYTTDVPDWGTRTRTASSWGTRRRSASTPATTRPARTSSSSWRSCCGPGSSAAFDFNSRFYADDDLMVGRGRPVPAVPDHARDRRGRRARRPRRASRSCSTSATTSRRRSPRSSAR